MLGSELLQSFRDKGYNMEGGYLPYAMDVGRYLKRHDVVFQSPQLEGYEGLPLGNGDMSLMLWSHNEGLRLQLNKNDAWTQPDGEAPMLLRSCARVNIDFGQPCNDWLYLNDFEARLSIGEAKASYRTSTPFCNITAQAFVDTGSNLVVMDISYESLNSDVEPVVRISLERYGSRAFAYWYNGIQRGGEKGLGQAHCGVRGEIITVEEQFDDTSALQVATAATLIGQSCLAQMVNNRRSEIEWRVADSRNVTLLIALASAHDQGGALDEALEVLKSGAQALEQVRARHSQWWKQFWDRSFLHISSEDSPAEYDYMENLYYLQLYTMGSASRGEYPMIFNGGAFTWNRDTRQWVNPHHWNIQQAYWSMEAANRPELMKPYFKAYSRLIPAACEFARRSKGVSRGMIISEMHDFSGRMLAYLGALTPASQIAQQYWNHYLYNLDMDFLRDTAYPFIRECADFYAEYARLNDETGKYDIGPAAVYECEFGEDFKNTVVDMTMVRYIMPVAIRAAQLLGLDADRAAKWADLLQNISDYLYFEDQAEETLAMGLASDGKKADFAVQNMGFCRNTAPLAPCPIIGLKDRGTRLYNAVCNAARTYPRNYLAITPISVVWARLGEGGKAIDLLFDSIAQLQHFPQGFFYNIDHWFQYSRYAKRVDDYLTECQRDYIYDHSLEYSSIAVRNGEAQERVDTPMQPFIQHGYEPAGILTHALHEMVLQSHEGVIRLLPAFPDGSECLFTMKAAGNFMVTGAAGKSGVCPYAIVKSLSGGICLMDVPFHSRKVCVVDAGANPVDAETTVDGFMSFATECGKTYIVYAEDISSNEIVRVPLDYTVNNAAKSYKQARLGRKRMF